ncbi:ProQ_Cterm domain protein [Halomonas elongata DSM 2581]|uniref:ProP effector n=2 Tax=Halomonas elongata TaxID=2746 RepID=A0A1B8P5P0_HALEL|nr:ProP effector [Halomonas elongata]CBV41587.1 ProQ_Cterm domain protein [Halomonas elongata DSM 2581]
MTPARRLPSPGVFGKAHLEDQDLIEERSTRLMVALEGRAETLLEALREARVQREAMSSRLDELERQRQSLEARNAELAAEAREGGAERESLERRVAELERRLADAEASCLELLEENRELDEQNRELEAHNRHLREDREVPAEGETASVFSRRGRPAQGLSALIGHRHRDSETPADEPASGESPATGPAEATPAADTAEASGRQDELPSIDEAPSPQALLEQWYQRYPNAFFKGHTRPLQVGIHEALAEHEPWPEKLVRRALACYVNLPRYLKAVREGAERIDLNGAPAGEVDAGAAEHARKKLDRLQSGRRKGAKPARRRPPAKGPRGEDAASDARQEERSQQVSAPQKEAGGRDDEPADSRLQRKLGELVARHNPR